MFFRPESRALEHVGDAWVGVRLVAREGGELLAQERGEILVHYHRLQRGDNTASEKYKQNVKVKQII